MAFTADEQTLINQSYDLVIELTKKAGELVCEGFYGQKIVETKLASWDSVTEYDRKVEDLLINGIRNKFPDHKFICEESEYVKEKASELTDDPTWIIDPIDGTYNFIHEFPLIAISVAMAYKKQVVIGIIYNPVTNHLFTSKRGEGAYLNGKRIYCSKVNKLESSMYTQEISIARVPACFPKHMNVANQVAKKADGFRAIGCAALDLAYIAKGSFDSFYIEDLKPWDIAAGSLLVQEAGGCVYHKDGGPYDIMKPDVVAACTESVASDLIAITKTK